MLYASEIEISRIINNLKKAILININLNFYLLDKNVKVNMSRYIKVLVLSKPH